MSTTCKKYFDKKFREDIWNRFLREIKNVKNREELDAFLDKYLTPQEKIMLEKRLGIFDLSERGSSYREISGELAVTSRTISFVKKGFKEPAKRIPKKNFRAAGLLGLEA
ncbi:MAG: Trp family transcriptional regulator [Patescibacteria group bacterium]